MNRKRDKRDPKNAIVGEPSSRHVKILTAIERWPLSDTKHLSLITGLSEDNIEQPIRELFDSNLIERLPNLLFNRSEETSPQVYGRNWRGTDWLESKELKPHRAIWISQGGQASHNLKVCLLGQQIEVALARAGYRFVPWDELLRGAPEETRKMKRPWRFTTTQHGHVEPDLIFAVEDPEGYWQLYFGELNLSDHGALAYETKARAYHEIIFQGIYKTQLGMENARATVFTASTNERQQQTMIDVTPQKDPSLFKLLPSYAPYLKAPAPNPKILEDWLYPAKPNRPMRLTEFL